MPKPKVKYQLIDIELSISCKGTLKLDDKRTIAQKHGISIGYVDMIIRRERGAAPEIARTLKSISNRIVKKLKQDEPA